MGRSEQSDKALARPVGKSAPKARSALIARARSKRNGDLARAAAGGRCAGDTPLQIAPEASELSDPPTTILPRALTSHRDFANPCCPSGAFLAPLGIKSLGAVGND